MTRQLALALAIVISGCTPYLQSWRTVSNVSEARDALDDGMEKALMRQISKCAAQNMADVSKTQSCLGAARVYRVVASWKVHGIPAVNEALRRAREVLLLAEKTHATPASVTTKVMSILKPVACGIVKTVKADQDLYKTEADVALKYLSGIRCE